MITLEEEMDSSYSVHSGSDLLLSNPSTQSSTTSDGGHLPAILSPERLKIIRAQMKQIKDNESIAIMQQLFSHSDALNDLIALERSSAQRQLSNAQSEAQFDQSRAQIEFAQVLRQAQILAQKLAELENRKSATTKNYYTSQPSNNSLSPVDEYNPAVGARISPHVYRYDYAAAARTEVELYKQRFADAEARCNRLSAELKRVRANFLHTAPEIRTQAEIIYPQTDSDDDEENATAPRRKKNKSRHTLGDAEAEHLLLASKSLRHIRRVDKFPLSKVIAIEADKILKVAKQKGLYGGVTEESSSASAKAPAAHTVASVELSPEIEQRDFLPALKFVEPKAISDSKRALSESLTETEAEIDTEEEDDVSNENVAQGPARTLSALDVLAEASASQSNLFEGQAEPVAVQDDESTQEEIEPEAEDDSEYKPSKSLRNSSNDTKNSSNRARFVSPPPAKKRKSISSSESASKTDKKRIPYIKWNLDEDEMLVKAVIKVGCRWEYVAAEVPNRNYHQVRQRFLRGLKEGTQLPKELEHYKKSLKKALDQHGRPRNGKGPSADL